MAARMWWVPIVPIGFFTDRGFRPRWLLMPGVVILAAFTSSIGKLAIRRPRPGSAYRVSPRGHLSTAGFPSTHSACAFAIAGWLRASRYGRWLHAVAVLIGYLRVRCRAHHSTDVLAGAILGYGVALQVERAWSRVVDSRRARVGASGKPSRARPFEPAAVEPTECEYALPPRDGLPVLGGREVSHRLARRRNGAVLVERRCAKTSSLEVG
jgi:hypothetical protein